MAEFVQKKIEDLRPIFEMIKKFEIFTESEVQATIKKIREHEYKLQRHTKSKEDYLNYIQYCMDLLKLVKLRREKLNITKRKSDIDFNIANKINHLYKDVIFKFQHELRLWISYMKFCKHVKFQHCVTRMMSRMLQVHQDKPKCWHIAAQWEIEENKDFQTARRFLLRGLHFHPESQLLYCDIFKLELTEAMNTGEKSIDLKKCIVIYEQALNKLKNVKFIIELLTITEEYNGTETFQHRILNDMLQQYPHEPLMWDTLARRELNGLIVPTSKIDENSMEVDTQEKPLRDRLNKCFEVYQTGVSTINTETMWSLFIDCMLEINQETDNLPNLKRKLLKNALVQASEAKKLEEKYYLYWINMSTTDQPNHDPTKTKLYEILCHATEALPESESLWHAKLSYLQINGQDNLAEEIFEKAINHLGEKSLLLWKQRLLYLKENKTDLENFFQKALTSGPIIGNFIKPLYVEWIYSQKNIIEARKIYKELCLFPPICLELHSKIIALELAQNTISLYDVRKAYEMSVMQFGKQNIDVWMNFIIFEAKHGEPLKVSIIYTRAIKTLNPELCAEFTVQYSLKKPHLGQ